MYVPNLMFIKTLLLCAGLCATPMHAQAQGRMAQVITSTSNLQLKLATERAKATNKPLAGVPVIALDPAQKHQTILGFGGTYSEATSYNLKRLPEAKRAEALRAFFHPTEGANWNLVRTTINSCDASSEHYSYAEVPNDLELKNFSIQKDLDNYMLPGLQQALAIQPALKLFASPWTPPVWMKTSGKHNEGALKPEYYASWALYFSKYLTAYAQHGVKLWGVTPQNEPEAYKQAWDACGWQPEEMNTFVKQHLGPQLKQDHPTIKILAWDHNKNHLMKWCNVLLNDPVTAPYFSYIAHHWYEDGEAKYYEPLLEAQRAFPQYPLLATEQGVFGLYLLQPEPAELYAKDIIGNLNHGSVAWVAWGMAFDHQGGPNHAKNFNHSPIMIDVAKAELHYNPSYYYLAQFSRYIQPGARRIGWQGTAGGLLVTACQNPNGQVVVALLNPTDTAQPYQLQAKGRYLPGTLPPRALRTVVW
jgi:glucosylceramidase